MGFCFGALRWSPDTFWRATPRELAAALGPVRAEPAGRADLARLMTLFPDV